MTTTYTKYRKIIEFRVMQELQFPFATCKIPFCTFMYVLYSQNLNFCEMMLTKHNRRILKINRCYMCISYIGLNLGFSSSPYAHSLAFKRYTQIPYLLERVPVVERTPPSSNQRPPFYVKYLMSASLVLIPLFSLKRNAHLRNSI